MHLYIYTHIYTHEWHQTVMNFGFKLLVEKGWAYQWLFKLSCLNLYLQETRSRALSNSTLGFSHFWSDWFCSLYAVTEFYIFQQCPSNRLVSSPQRHTTGSTAICFAVVNIKLLYIMVFNKAGYLKKNSSACFFLLQLLNFQLATGNHYLQTRSSAWYLIR